MALLLLWEVDHDQPFPTKGTDDLTAALGSFTKRLALRAAKDPRLAWLKSEDMAMPLAPGLAPSHHRRWSVRVMAPAAAEPQGWYTDFVARWRAYTEALVCPPGSRPMSEVSEDLLMRVRPALRQRSEMVVAVDSATSSAAVATQSSATPSVARRRRQAQVPAGSQAQEVERVTPQLQRPRVVAAGPESPPSQSPTRSPACTSKRATPRSRRSRAVDGGLEPQPEERRVNATARSPYQASAAPRLIRPREVDVGVGPPLRRQRTLTSWLQPRSAPLENPEEHADPYAARHGRATAGPPT